MMRVPEDTSSATGPSPRQGRPHGRPAAPGFDAALASAGRGSGPSAAAPGSKAAPHPATAVPGGPALRPVSFETAPLPFQTGLSPAGGGRAAVSPGTLPPGTGDVAEGPSAASDGETPAVAPSRDPLTALATLGGDTRASQPAARDVPAQTVRGDAERHERAAAPLRGPEPSATPPLSTPSGAGPLFSASGTVDLRRTGGRVGTTAAPSAASPAAVAPEAAAASGPSPPTAPGSAESGTGIRSAALAALSGTGEAPRAGATSPSGERGGDRLPRPGRTAPAALNGTGEEGKQNVRSARGEFPVAPRSVSPVAADLNTVVRRRETHFAPVPPRETVVGGGRAPGHPSLPGPAAPAAPHPLAAAPQPSAVSAPSAPVSAPPARIEAPAVIGQIAQALATSAGGATPQSEPGAAAPPSPPAPSPAAHAMTGPVRILELQLQPAALGALTVTMRLFPSGLKVTMSATSRETAQMLQENRAELSELIRRVGYGGADVSVEHAAAANADAGGSGADRDASSDRRQPPELPQRAAPKTSPDESPLHRSIFV